MPWIPRILRVHNSFCAVKCVHQTQTKKTTQKNAKRIQTHRTHKMPCLPRFSRISLSSPLKKLHQNSIFILRLRLRWPVHVSAVSTSQQTKIANSSGFWRYEPHMWPRPVLKSLRVMVFTRQNDLSLFLFFVNCLDKLLVRLRRRLILLEFFHFLTNN